MRACQGHLAATQAKTTFSSPGPSIPTTARIITSLGSAIHARATRIMKRSSAAEPLAAIPAHRAPTAAVAHIAATAEKTVVRMPQTRRESTSRPRWSVPKRCSRPGAANFSASAILLGEGIGRIGASTPSASTTSMKTKAANAARSSTKRDQSVGPSPRLSRQGCALQAAGASYLRGRLMPRPPSLWPGKPRCGETDRASLRQHRPRGRIPQKAPP